jgi:hypothetical protein
MEMPTEGPPPEQVPVPVAPTPEREPETETGWDACGADFEAKEAGCEATGEDGACGDSFPEACWVLVGVDVVYGPALTVLSLEEASVTASDDNLEAMLGFNFCFDLFVSDSGYASFAAASIVSLDRGRASPACTPCLI